MKLPCDEIFVAKLPCGEVTGNLINDASCSECIDMLQSKLIYIKILANF